MTSETVESIATQSQIDEPYGSEETLVDDEDLTDVDLTGKILAEIYRIQSKIGAGSFGQVYLCENLRTHDEWAIKIESKTKNDNSQLFIEIYSILRGARGFPRVDFYGSEGNFDLLVIEFLGPSLEDLFNYCQRKFSLKTSLMLVDQMITRIEYVHQCHLIHRDIKPGELIDVSFHSIVRSDNFLMGMRQNGNLVYIIDFGLSKRYRDPDSFVHIPWKTNKSLTGKTTPLKIHCDGFVCFPQFKGTARYASINAHKGNEQSRRDDLEAISYVFMYFILGSLPWQGLQATGKKPKFERIAEMKMQLSVEQICKNQPKECFLFLHYCRTLPFDHRPDYDYLRYLFRFLLQQIGETFDYDYDWLILHRDKQTNVASEQQF